MKNQHSIPHHQRRATLCKNLILPFGDYTPEEVYEMIRSNAFKKDTDLIRLHLDEGRVAEAQNIKRRLYGYTPASTWFPTRRESNVKEITGNIIIEADHLTKAELEHIAWVTYPDPHSMMGFVTSSGSGFKWICPTNAATVEEHRIAYRQLCQYYASLLGKGIECKLDINQPDPVRLMFLSCDQSAFSFFKTDYRVFFIAKETKQFQSHEQRDCFVSRAIGTGCSSLSMTDVNEMFQRCIRFTNRRRQFTEGNRNNFIFLLSCYCRMNGLREEDTLTAIIRHYNFNQREIRLAVKSAYRYK